MRDPADKDDSYVHWPEWADERERCLALIEKYLDADLDVIPWHKVDNLILAITRGDKP